MCQQMNEDTSIPHDRSREQNTDSDNAWNFCLTAAIQADNMQEIPDLQNIILDAICVCFFVEWEEGRLKY